MWQLVWALKTLSKLSYIAERRKVIYGREESMEGEWSLGKKERKHGTLGEMQAILCDWHYGRPEMEESRTIKKWIQTINHGPFNIEL